MVGLWVARYSSPACATAESTDVGRAVKERNCFAFGHYSVAEGSLNDNRHAPWLRKVPPPLRNSSQ
jgi:hypothetical protein